VHTLREVTDEVLRRDGRAALQYGPADGYPPLREYVAEMLRARGLEATSDHILITNGSQQALDLACRALLDPGDGVVVESPTYLAAIQTFDSLEARYHTVAMDGQGMGEESLSQALVRRPKLLYTLPNFQNPTGISMTLSRRQAAATAALDAGAAVLEDDAYYDLRYDGSPLPPVAALAPNPWAVYTGTFSKVVAPGLRVGYLWAAPELVERLAQLKQITDLHTGSLTQRVVHEYCASGRLEPGIDRLRETYRARRDTMLQALESHLSGLARWTRPQGGMFIWVTLPEGTDAGELLPLAMERGVVFVPGASFHVGGVGGRNTFRLNFVSADEERIIAGIRALAGVIREWLP
ncbi:MAG TPA: PLP-dependent aminotransferase family protein, partial [Armatimonadota bacterium]|nr:PLP-dependent aminotransferase family protein [Armatimonadota bacterium]